MPFFYEHHPGSALGRELMASRRKLIQVLIQSPKQGIEALVKEYAFGAFSDFWDDHIYNFVISPALSTICDLSLPVAINTYSAVDHLLFKPYIRRDEDPIRFRRAFWNVNTYGKRLADRMICEYSKNSPYVLPVYPDRNRSNSKKIAFLFKGPFRLAHAEFFCEFLKGAKVFCSSVHIYLILIDEHVESLACHRLDHINILSLAGHQSAYAKLSHYLSLAAAHKFDHVSWIACVQNLSLFMGGRIVSSQSYWSMKYHSIIMDSLDKYAGLGFGGKSFTFDDVEWYRGRAFPDLTLPNVCKDVRQNIRRNLNIPLNGVLGGCFVRSEKLNNVKFWDLLQLLLTNNENFYFVIATQALPQISNRFLSLPVFRQKFHNVGWVKTKEYCQYLDLYLDSFPRGSCLTALEAIKAQVPVILFDTDHNRESSALPYLISANQGLLPQGVLDCQSLSSIARVVNILINNTDSRSQLALYQSSLLSSLEGGNALFAKDYLNYFLDLNLSFKNI